MSIPILTSIVPALTSLLYLVLLLIVAIRHPILKQGAWKWLITCLGVCLAWSITYTLIFLEVLPGKWLEWVLQIGLLLVTSLLLRLTRSALKDTRRFYFWNLGAIAWFGLYIGLALSKTQVLHDIAAGVFVVGWVIFMTAIAEAILRVRRSDSAPSSG